MINSLQWSQRRNTLMKDIAVCEQALQSLLATGLNEYRERRLYSMVLKKLVGKAKVIEEYRNKGKPLFIGNPARLKHERYVSYRTWR